METDQTPGSLQEVDLRPPPAPDDTTKFFWDAAADGRLVAQSCNACGRIQYPPDIVCVYCRSESLGTVELSGKGTIYSFALVERAFHPGFVPHVPYVVALVELDEQPGLRMFTNIVDCDPARLTVGQTVEAVFEQRGTVTLPQFRPVTASA